MPVMPSPWAIGLVLTLAALWIAIAFALTWARFPHLPTIDSGFSMKNLLTAGRLAGYRTYILAFVGLIYALGHWLAGDMTTAALIQEVPVILGSLMGASLRAGVAAAGSKPVESSEFIEAVPIGPDPEVLKRLETLQAATEHLKGLAETHAGLLGAWAGIDSPENTTGWELIAEERQRQIDEEGYTAEHDDGYGEDELALAAAWMILPADVRQQLESNDMEFWHQDFPPFFPDDRIRELTIAGALAAAEIDRRLRLKQAGQAPAAEQPAPADA
jgi:hypothetical protein